MARKRQSKHQVSPKQDLPGQIDLEDKLSDEARGSARGLLSAIDSFEKAVHGVSFTTVDGILPAENGVVVEGEFAGQTTEQALTILLDRVHDALAEASLPAATATIDMAQAEILIMHKLNYGDRAAHDVALGFIATALPYVIWEEEQVRTFGEELQRILK
jgi:hypothetical protein